MRRCWWCRIFATRSLRPTTTLPARAATIEIAATPATPDRRRDAATAPRRGIRFPWMPEMTGTAPIWPIARTDWRTVAAVNLG